ncbi:MAG: 3-hydroxyacyl-CoA dehydrogenase family protein [Pseudomonadota bacterium]
MAVGIMSADEPITCCVLGNGTMGAQIALSLALGGAVVNLWGRRPGGLPESKERCREGYEFLVGERLADPEDAEAVLARIGLQGDLDTAVSEADFIIEAVAEDLAIKTELLARAEKLAGEDAILSSTTSALSASDIQAGLANPGRFCVAHYAQPAHLVGLVEVVPGRRTEPEVTDAVIRILSETGKTPVLCPDIPGFLWARIQHAVLREFVTLVGQGLVTPEACDTVLKQGYASRLPAMGAFEHADLAGLDLLNGNAARAVWADLSNITDPDLTPLGSLFKDGHTGMKSGKGFYDWTNERDPEAFKQKRDEEIVRRIKIQRGAEVKL